MEMIKMLKNKKKINKFKKISLLKKVMKGFDRLTLLSDYIFVNKKNKIKFKTSIKIFPKFNKVIFHQKIQGSKITLPPSKS